MSTAPAARPLQVRHLQMARALLAAIAAVMITFSPDHSAQVGLAVFSGYTLTSALVLFMAAWTVYRSGPRWPAVSLAAIMFVAGLVAGLVGLRSSTLLFVLVISWAVLTGIVETVAGSRGLRAGEPGTAVHSEARDALAVGILTLVLAAALALVPSGYALQYYIADAERSFTLTGTTIGVGIFGAYAAIVAVYLAIAAFSPRRPVVLENEAEAVSASHDGSAP